LAITHEDDLSAMSGEELRESTAELLDEMGMPEGARAVRRQDRIVKLEAGVAELVSSPSSQRPRTIIGPHCVVRGGISTDFACPGASAGGRVHRRRPNAGYEHPIGDVFVMRQLAQS
jgi:hypothetical protein